MKTRWKLICLSFGLLAAIGCSQMDANEHPEAKTSKKHTAKNSEKRSFSLLPEKNELPLTAASICAGIENVADGMVQDIADERPLICTGTTPTALLQNLVANPWTGVGPSNYQRLERRELNGGLVKLSVAYSMRISKKAVPLVLGEEDYVKSSRYADDDGFSINFSFIDPPMNNGDCDTAFAVRQFSKREGDRVEFEDFSFHDLKLYRLHPDNFDFLMAVRTLQKPSEQFKRSGVIRTIMTDPTDDDMAISVSVISLIMNGRGEEDRLLDIVENYVRSDVQSVYNFHSR